jgi:predicted MFS family arabinose efflux permease
VTADSSNTRATAAALTLGCVGLLMLGLQPLVLGALLDAHRLTITSLSLAATLELLTLGLTTGIMGGAVPHTRLRYWAILGLVILAAANAAGSLASFMFYAATRAAAGIGGGILLWVAIGLITLSATPARLTALFLASQAASQGITAALLPVAAMAAFGVNGALLALAGLTLLAGLLVPALPAGLPPHPRPEGGHGRIPLRGWLGLAATFCEIAGLIGLWVFVTPIAQRAGVTPALAEYVPAVGLGAQFIGALAASALAERLPPARAMVACVLALLGCVAVIGGRHGDAAFVAATAGFGFLWMASMPFLVPLLIRVDPSRRSALLIAGAQLLGGATGPVLMGALATATNVTPVLWLSAALFAATIALVVATARRK